MNGRSSDSSPPSKDAEDASELQPIAGSSPNGADDGEDTDTSGNFDDIVQTFAEETSLPGVPRVILARSRLSRYFWIFVCLTCAISFGVGIFQLLERYFSYNKKVTVEMVSEPVPFPKVTLCNMRSIDFDVLNIINDLFKNNPDITQLVGSSTGNEFIDAYIKFVAKFFPMWSDNATSSNKEMVAALNEAISRISMFNEIPMEIISEAGIRLEQYVARCSLGGAPCNMSRDFRRSFNQYYFNCYTYDPSAATPRDTESGADDESQLPWLSPGLDNGLSIVVLTGSGMLTRNANVTVIPGLYDMGSAISGADGVRVIIHAPDVVPFPLAEGFDVPPGFSVSFGVRPRRNVRIGPPHGDCVSKNPFDLDAPADEAENGGKTTKHRPYRQMVCQKQCIQQFIKADCDCYDETLLCDEEEDLETVMCHASDHFPESCVSQDSPECYEALTKQYSRVKCAKSTRDRVRASRELMSKCGCRSACDELLYDVSYSISRWPASGYEGDAVYNELIISPDGSLFLDKFNAIPEKKRTLEKHFNESVSNRMDALRDFARINVYVSDPEVVVTTESEDYDISTLVSDVGGQLGVWIGLSVITAAEVVELVIMVAGRSVQRRQQHKRRSAKKTAPNNI